jgi:hypothetical protein
MHGRGMQTAKGEGDNSGKRATKRDAGDGLSGRVQSEGRGAAGAERLVLRRRALKTAHTFGAGATICGRRDGEVGGKREAATNQLTSDALHATVKR